MVAPVTSSTPQPGFNAPGVATDYTSATNPQWREALTQYLAGAWANGWRGLPGGWNNGSFGQPNPNDTNGVASPGTMLAFAQYANAYQPGQSEWIDSNMPYVPPGAQDYVEDPSLTVARIADEHFNKSLEFNYAQLDQNAKNAARAALNAAYANDIARYGVEAGIFATQEQAKQNAFNTMASLYATDEGNKVQAFNILSGMYEAQEQNRLTGLQSAGSLSLALQQIKDDRVKQAIALHANPNDMVAREYAVRALKEPTPSEVGYSEVDTLGEVIRKLIDFQPTGGFMNRPDAPVLGQNRPTAPAAGTPPVMQRSSGGAGTVSGGATSSYPGTEIPYGDDQRNREVPAAPEPWKNEPWDVLMHSTNPPPEAQRGAPVSPENQAMLDRFRSLRGQLPGASNYATGTKGGFTESMRMIIGDPQDDGKPNPELVEIDAPPGTKVRTKITPVKGLKGKKAKKMAKGTKKYAEGGSLETVLKSYDDEAYQNLPSLKYLQGGMSKTGYNRLATGTTQGAFGTRIPESGNINYGKYLNIQKDPVAHAALSSLYKSASRDLTSEAARAKARAPFGQAVATTLIRT